MAQIQIKRGLETNLAALTLAAGELAYTTDTHKLYIGVDGTTAKILLNENVDLTDIIDDSADSTSTTYSSSKIKALIAASEAGDVIGYYLYGRTDPDTEFPVDEAGAGAIAFDFSTNTEYSFDEDAWVEGTAITPGANAEIEVQKMLDGTGVSGLSLVGHKADALWKDSTWVFIGVLPESGVYTDDTTVTGAGSEVSPIALKAITQSNNTTTDTLDFGDTFAVDAATINGYGQVTGKTTTEFTLPDIPEITQQDDTASESLDFGDTFEVETNVINSTGNVTGTTTTTFTLPSFPSSIDGGTF
jgi:hypothetical protein